MGERTYLCIDLKSFYASVECVERKLDAMTAKLVVADPERERGTICLAVSPALKALGVANRCRVFQIPEGIEYIMAPPRMQLYIDYAAKIYGIYLKYISKEDIFVYSIDEAFMDVTDYLSFYQMTAQELGSTIMADIMETLHLPATCGIGTNLYLCKIALDITAKHSPDRIGYLDETIYRQTLWTHRPLTDFWRIGPGIARRLESMGLLTMKDIALCDPSILHHAFGIEAEYLIDHAFGKEPVTLPEVKAYTPKNTSIGSGQVLMRDYSFEEGLLIAKEMTDLLCLDLTAQGLIASSITLHVGYSKGTLPSVNGTSRLRTATDSNRILLDEITALYKRIVRPDVPVRRLSITFPRVMNEACRQYDLFTDTNISDKDREVQKAVLQIKEKFGKNAILKGMNFQESATTRERNHQIGGHKSGT